MAGATREGMRDADSPDFRIHFDDLSIASWPDGRTTIAWRLKNNDIDHVIALPTEEEAFTRFLETLGMKDVKLKVEGKRE